MPTDRTAKDPCSNLERRGGVPNDRSEPLPPPWATRTVHEDGGITHERLSEAHPLVNWPSEEAEGRPSDVSVSVVDRLGRQGWVRSLPMIQVEGGSYSLCEARQLLDAISEAIAAAEPPASAPMRMRVPASRTVSWPSAPVSPPLW